MVRSKNKPKKNAAVVSPAAIPTGTTEVIAPAPTSTPAPATTNPTFTQIGMAGMIGMIGATAVAEEPKAEEPKAEEPKAEEPKAEEPKAEEPNKMPLALLATRADAEEPKTEEPIAATPIPESSGGIFGFFRRFYNSLGGAVHR